MSPPAQSWPFLDPMLPHLYWPWESTHNKPPTCNPSSQSLLPRECNLRHLSANCCQHNSQGKVRSLLLYVDPSVIYASSEWKAKSLAIYMWLHPLRNSVSSTTPATLAVPQTIHRLPPQDFGTYCSVFLARSLPDHQSTSIPHLLLIFETQVSPPQLEPHTEPHKTPLNPRVHTPFLLGLSPQQYQGLEHCVLYQCSLMPIFSGTT